MSCACRKSRPRPIRSRRRSARWRATGATGTARRATRASALHVSQALSPERPAFSHPAFDYENRIVMVRLPAVTVVSVYVPNGGKDYPAKMRFLAALEEFAADSRARAAADRDLRRPQHRAHRHGRPPEGAQAGHDRPAAGGARSARAHHRRGGLVDTGRALAPDDDQMFTWWAPWRNMRQRNIGWRLDYVLASHALFRAVRACAVQREDRHERSRAGGRRVRSDRASGLVRSRLQVRDA